MKTNYMSEASLEQTHFIDEILVQFNGKTFNSTEQVNDFFREKLQEVEKNTKQEIIKIIEDNIEEFSLTNVAYFSTNIINKIKNTNK